jgi:hypothetical protein
MKMLKSLFMGKRSHRLIGVNGSTAKKMFVLAFLATCLSLPKIAFAKDVYLSGELIGSIESLGRTDVGQSVWKITTLYDDGQAFRVTTKGFRGRL